MLHKICRYSGRLNFHQEFLLLIVFSLFLQIIMKIFIFSP